MTISEHRDSSLAVAHSSFTGKTVLQGYDERLAQANKAQLLRNLLYCHLLYKNITRLNEWLDTEEKKATHFLPITYDRNWAEYFCFVNKDDMYPFTELLTRVSFALKKSSYVTTSDDGDWNSTKDLLCLGFFSP